MRKFLMATTLMLSVFLAGCNQEKVQVTQYVEQLHASNMKMKSMAEEMQQSMATLQQEFAQGSFDAEKVKTNIQGYADKMKAEKESLESLQVPAKAQALHEASVKQYQVAIDVLGETIPMIDIAKKLSDAGEKIKKDPKQAKTVMEEAQKAQTEMMAVQGKIMELAKQAKEYEDKAKAEQKKLEEEFGITIDTGASATPAVPAEGAQPTEGAAPEAAPAAPAAPATPAAPQ